MEIGVGMKKFIIVLGFVFLFSSIGIARADNPVAIHLTIATDTQILFEGDETVTPCENSPASGVDTTNGYCAVIQSGLSNPADWSWFGTDGFLNTLGGFTNDFGNPNTYWGWFSDLVYGSTSLSSHSLTAGENLLLSYNTAPLKLSVSNLAPTQHDTVTFTLEEFGLDSSFNPIWNPALAGAVTVNGTAHTVASDGTFALALDNTSTYTIVGSESGFVNSNTITLNPAPDTTHETVLIRNGNTVIYQGTIALPSSGTIDITDDASVVHQVNSQSVLGVLYALDQTTTDFELSDLQYFNSFGSFYLKCLTAGASAPTCDNWQFVVNGTTPSTSMDATVLTGGESLAFYFGTPHQVLLSSSAISTGGTVTATAQNYNYNDNTWSALTGVTIGATQPDPSNPFSPIVVTSGVVDANGSVALTFASAGNYDIGIAEDFYFPTYPLTVSASSSGGGSGGGTPTAFSVPNALAYLSSVQGTDGSFGGSTLYTDWAGIAIASAGGPRGNILSYLSAHNSISSLLTDNERRAMTLMSLGQNPYSFGGIDYITAIVSKFDGTQFGDVGIVNDDIFALIPLRSAGYSSSDGIITTDIAFILSKQQGNGSWEGSIDLTASAVQALSPFSGVSGVSTALSNAGNYIQNAQGNDGGWSNVSSSSWAIQAMNALGASWTKNGKSTADYFGSIQATDGAGSPTSESLQNRIWTTSYAIPAVLGKSWSSIMQSVSKPTEGGSGGGTTVTDDTKKIDEKEKTETKKEDEKKEEQEKIVPVEEIQASTTPSNVAKSPTVKNVIVPKPSEVTQAEIPLVANATSSGAPATVPIVLASGSVLSLLYFVARRFIW